MTFLLSAMIGSYNKDGIFKDTCIFCGLNDTTHIAVGSCNWLNRFFIGVNEYDSYEMLTFASWKTKVC